VDVAGAGLLPADAVIFQAGSVSRARILLEGLDPSVRNERDPDDRDLRLDLYDPDNPRKPPYDAAFIAEYRQAQLARMRRITAEVKERLERLRNKGGKEMERCFVVHRTMADPRYIDPSVEPNDRKPNWFLSGDPETVNSGPVGFARYSSLRSWLSQWSIDDSRADAAASAARISVSFFAIENSADDGAPPSHMREVFASCASLDKRYLLIEKANHYYANQPELLAQASNATLDFLRARSLIDF
jgi:hypothetical protein